MDKQTTTNFRWGYNSGGFVVSGYEMKEKKKRMNVFPSQGLEARISFTTLEGQEMTARCPIQAFVVWEDEERGVYTEPLFLMGGQVRSLTALHIELSSDIKCRVQPLGTESSPAQVDWRP